MAKTKQRIDWRGFAKRITNDDDLIYPDVQRNHPVVKELKEWVFWNALTPKEREAVEKYFTLTGSKPLPAKEILKIVRRGNIDKGELTEMLFTGMLDEIAYQGYLEEKESKPGVSARDYFNYMRNREKDKAVLKLARIFEAILDENEPEQEEPLPYISRATFEKMKHDVKWVQENLKAIERSRGIWPKLGRRSS